MEFELPTQIYEVIKKLEEKGFEIYLVGGAVRDLMMRRPIYDWDFTTNAIPDEIIPIFPDSFYDNAFGTVMIPNDLAESPFDITTFRTEHNYSDARRPDEVKWGKTLEEDLKRRDFTINAMALKVARNTAHNTSSNMSFVTSHVEIIDPFDGQKDLNDRIVRAVGNPDERFAEDALRMMRALRIASELNFTIDDKTKTAIENNVDLIDKIAKERVRDELLKMLTSPHAFNAINTFREVGLMTKLLPELEKCFGIEQKSPGRHHIYDVGTHCVMSLKFCPSNDPIVKLATLIHDIGKAQTVKKLPTGVITFYNHELVGGRIAKRIADRLKLSNKQKDKLYRLVRYHQFTVDERQTDSAIRRFITKVGKDLIHDMLDLRVADRLGGGAAETSWRLEEFKLRLIEVQKQPFSIQDLKISGNDVMQELGIKPGPKVGEILKNLYDEVVAKNIENEKSALMQKLKDYN